MRAQDREVVYWILMHAARDGQQQRRENKSFGELFDIFTVSDYIGFSQRPLRADLSLLHGSRPR